MTLNLEQCMEKIRFIERAKRNDRELAEHSRLLLFHEIVDGFSLEKNKVEEYSNNLSGGFKPFTKLISSSFMLLNEDLIAQRKMSPIYLPIDDDYHLLFFLIKENETMLNVHYDSCSGCKLPPHEFPHVELRKSINLQDIKGSIMYDNRMSIR